MYIDESTGCKVIDLGDNWKFSFSDTDNSVQNFEDYIDEIGWRYEDSAVRKIFDESVYAKMDITAILRNHPNYVDYLKGIVILADISRDIDTYVTGQFYDWLSKKAREICNGNGWDTYRMSNIVYYLAGINEQTITSDYAINALEDLFKIEDFGLQKLHVHRGQKRSKIVGKFCRMIGVDKFEDFSKMFAMYGDAINPDTVKLPTLITTNANDFVRMSDGAGGWRSCHNPDKSAYSGCNCSGGISHALDDTSIIMYTVKESCNGNYQIAKKVDRCVFFAGRNSEGEIKWFIQSKVYPDGTEQKSEEFRRIFQKVLSECMGIPNLWKKGNMSDDWARISSSEYSTAYPDFEYCDRNIIVPFHPSDVSTEDFQRIYVGARPICVECGCRHDYKDEINCCHYFGGKTCDNCGADLDSDEDVRYSSFHGAYGCEQCMSWCEVADDYFFEEDDWELVENINEYVPVCYMEYHSEDFQRCEECGDWLFIGSYGWYARHNTGYMVDADGNYYCNSCGEDVLYPCADCGELYRSEDMTEIDGEYYCEYCADRHDDHSTAIA